MLAALCARASFHAQENDNHPLPGDRDEYRCDWRKGLYNTLILRLQTLEEDYPGQKNSSDLSLLFANFLAQASVIYLCGNAQSFEWQAGSPNYQNSLENECQQLAISAAHRIVEISGSLLDFPVCKVTNDYPLYQPQNGCILTFNPRFIPSHRFLYVSVSDFYHQTARILWLPIFYRVCWTHCVD
jgi:hypothetical protein